MVTGIQGGGHIKPLLIFTVSHRGWRIGILISENAILTVSKIAEKQPANFFFANTVDGSEIRLISWYGTYPIIYRVLYLTGGAGFLNHQQ